MDEMFSIFTESSEDKGIMYKSYEPVLGSTRDFLNDIERSIKDVNDDPFDKAIDLTSRIDAFKKSVNRDFKPGPIVIPNIKKTIKTVEAYRKDLDKVLDHYAKLRDQIAYGGNFKRDSIQRPKVYSKDIDEDKYAKVNNNIRNLNRAMDWAEKVLIDLYNMVDQDLNILNIVNRVYAKSHIYEGTELPAGVVAEDVGDSIIPMLPGDNTKPIEEGRPWIVNTRDKKTGDAPAYIRRNHNMADYIPGEGIPDDDEEPTLDSYKRPSHSPSRDYDDEDEEEPVKKEDEPEEPKPSGVSNYYYYTYNNSLNKNSHSFNKDSSSHDDHSRHTDDHSYGKHINSHNNTNDEDEDERKSFHTLENAKPWELPIPSNNAIVESRTHTVDEKLTAKEAEADRPKSDHPIKDTLTDIDQRTVKYQQKAKKAVQDVVNVGKAAVKPVKRASDWIGDIVNQWKDMDETRIKERMADPHARSNLFSAIRAAIVGGSLMKAGLLFNPVIVFLGVTRGIGKNKREFRIRNEMIGEIKTEIAIIDEKIQDCERRNDLKGKYRLMHYKNEMQKKLMRVGGEKGWSKII